MVACVGSTVAWTPPNRGCRHSVGAPKSQHHTSEMEVVRLNKKRRSLQVSSKKKKNGTEPQGKKNTRGNRKTKLKKHVCRELGLTKTSKKGVVWVGRNEPQRTPWTQTGKRKKDREMNRSKGKL